MRVSYEARLRELGARHHADVEAWKRRELNKVRDAAVAEVRRVQLDSDRVCGEVGGLRTC
jgi:predicted flap endonuclease-1-like 5' DNA nuclease